MTREVVIRDDLVTEIHDAPGEGPIPIGTQILVGRDTGAKTLMALQVGDRVDITYPLAAQSGASFQFAVGGTPILTHGVPLSGLDDRERAPRSATGVVGGRRLFLVTVDGRQESSVGTTLTEFAQLLVELGVHDAVNLDGGGSSTLTLADTPHAPIRIVNSPSDPQPRHVANAVAIRLDDDASFRITESCDTARRSHRERRSRGHRVRRGDRSGICASALASRAPRRGLRPALGGTPDRGTPPGTLTHRPTASTLKIITSRT